MGFLKLDGSLPSFTKAVISVWFRVPAAVLSAAAGLPEVLGGRDYDGWCGACYSPAMYKIIPLLTFGALEVTLPGSGFGGDQCSPSFIGIDVSSSGYGPNPPRLAVNLQTSSVCSFSKAPQEPQNEQRPECYYMGGYSPDNPLAGIPPQSLTVAADRWHHALISFDLSGGCSITYANIDRTSVGDPTFSLVLGPKFSWALDDVSGVGPAMLPAGSGGNNWGLDTTPTTIADQHILPQGFFTIQTGGDTTLPVDAPSDFTISVADSTIGSGTVGIPSCSPFIDSVVTVELAELQVYTGVSADCTDVLVRRLFVTGTGKPASTALPQAEFGQADIALSGSSTDWISGINSGSAANFLATGTITKYAIDPGL